MGQPLTQDDIEHRVGNYQKSILHHYIDLEDDNISPDFVRQMIEFGVDVDHADTGFGRTALISACFDLKLNKDIIPLLLESGASIDIRDHNGFVAFDHFYWYWVLKSN